MVTSRDDDDNNNNNNNNNNSIVPALCENDDDDDDDDYSEHDDEMSFKLFKAWFVPCRRLRTYLTPTRESTELLMSHAEYELGETSAAAAAAGAGERGTPRKNARSLVDLLAIKTSGLTCTSAGNDDEGFFYDFDQAFQAMLNEGLYPSEPGENGITPSTSVVWLSPVTFAAKGFFFLDNLEDYSNGRVTRLLSISANLGPRLTCERVDFYRARCDDTNRDATRTQTNGGEEGDDDACLGVYLSALARRSTWREIRVYASPSSATLAPSTARGVKNLVATGRQRRDVTFPYDFRGLTGDQWRELLRDCQPHTRIGFDPFKKRHSEWIPHLLDAPRQNASPKRLQLYDVDEFPVLEDLTVALASCSSVSDLTITVHNGGREAQNAFIALLGAVKANLYIEELEVGEFLSSAEWARLWEVAASHPALSSVRVGHDSVYGLHLRRDEPAGFDRLHAVERAIRSNGNLISIEVMDEQFFDGTTRPVRHSTRFKNRVLRALEWNRMSALSNDVKKCEDMTWRVRLFTSTLFRLCRAREQDDDKEEEDRNFQDKASYCFVLLRRNPDVLERAVRADDVLLQQWNKHMSVVDAHLDRVLQLERRMAQRGLEVPSSRPYPHAAGWKKRKYESVEQLHSPPLPFVVPSRQGNTA